MNDPAGYFIHEQAICETRNIGPGTRVWAFAHILPRAQIGSNCNVCAHVFIENDVKIGNNVTVKSGVQLWDGVEIEDDVFIGPNATFTNDRFPRSKRYPDVFAKTLVQRGASIGANATLLPGIRIGPSAVIGAGAVVTKDVPSGAIVAGNPARIINYATSHMAGRDRVSVWSAAARLEEERSHQKLPLGVGGCALLRLPSFEDMRGRLTPIEHERSLPFASKRSFLVYAVPSDRVRGEHAHRSCEQVLIAVHGRVSVVVDDTANQAEVTLDAPKVGLYVPAMIWAVQRRFTADAILLVHASQSYESSDYIRDYLEYAQIVQKA